MTWIPMHIVAPPDEDVLLCTKTGLVYQGRLRRGYLGEPQQGVVDWRATCCGRFATPVKWMPLSQLNKDKDA